MRKVPTSVRVEILRSLPCGERAQEYMAIFVHDMAYMWHICTVLYKNSLMPLGTLYKAKQKFV